MSTCPFDDLFSGAVSVHSMVPELHKLKLEEETDAADTHGEDQSTKRPPASKDQRTQIPHGDNQRTKGTIWCDDHVEDQKTKSPKPPGAGEHLATRDESCQLHRVVILGSAEVGKSSLIRQLPTVVNPSIYGGCPSANVESALCKVHLDDWTAQLELLDPYPSSMWLGLVHGDQQAAEKLKEFGASLLIVVYAVDDHLSLTHASRLLNCLKRLEMLGDRPAILVANKADLARKRVVSAAEGKQLAERYSLTYLETSSGLGFNLDKLMAKMSADLKAGESGEKPVKKSSIKEKVFGLVSKKYSK